MSDSKRRCAFCGKTPLTLEHVIPQWMHTYIDTARGPVNKVRVLETEEVGPDGEMVTTFHERGREPTAKKFGVRVVCARCNNGWMAKLERATKPILLALQELNAEVPTRTDQLTLARWAIKTASMYEYVYGVERVFTPVQLRQLARGEVPHNTRVSLGTSEQQDINLLRTGSGVEAVDESETPRPSTTLVASSTVVHFGFVVMHVQAAAGDALVEGHVLLHGPERRVRGLCEVTHAPLAAWPVFPAMTAERVKFIARSGTGFDDDEHGAGEGGI